MGKAAGLGFICFLLCLVAFNSPAAETFRVATYNLNNYLETATESRPAKTAESKAKVRVGIRQLHADVIALDDVFAVEHLAGALSSAAAERLLLVSTDACSIESLFESLLRHSGGASFED